MLVIMHKPGGPAAVQSTSVMRETARMPADQAQALERLVRDCGFFDLPERVGHAADGRPNYIVTVEDVGRRHVVTFHDDGDPAHAALRRLVQELD